MQIKLVLIVVALGAAVSGCATPEGASPATIAPAASAQAKGKPDDAPPPPQPVKVFTTGSRLPYYDSDGSNSVNRASKDAYEDEMHQRIQPDQRR